MNLIHTKSLSKEQHDQIVTLLNKCQDFSPVHVSFPFEDGNFFLLLMDASDTPVAVMGLIMPPDDFSDEEPVECVAFTRPSSRRRGYFSELLEKACELSGEHDILFPVDPESADTMATMRSIDADCVDTEFQMKWCYDPNNIALDSSLISKFPLIFTCTKSNEGNVNESVDTESCWDTFHSSNVPDPSVTILTYRFHELDPDPSCSPVAECMVLMQPVAEHSGAFHACFYGFHVHELCRGIGIGESVFYHVLKDLITRGCTQIVLHVGGDNYPAISIYKKAGFRITETLSYFMY